MLTKRQKEVLDFVVEQQQRGVSPTDQEIQVHFGFGSRNAVRCHLSALEAKGALKREPHKARGLTVAGVYRARPTRSVPIYGMIPAGFPSDQRQEPDGCVALDMEMLRLPKGAQVFALKVQGDSMNGAGILPGDMVVMEFREAKQGDVVAALIDGETTLKRYIVQRGRPFLKAENPAYPNLIPARELVIQGVMIAVLRVLKR